MLWEYLRSHRSYPTISRDMRKKQKARVASDPLRRLRVKSTYDDGVDFSVLAVQIDRFKWLVRSSETTFDRNATAFDVLQWLAKSCLLDSTPYICLCLKLCLTVVVSIASCERSFSKLKMIKSYLRSTMSDDRLSALSILSIEGDYVQRLDFEDIIANFASAKARKVQI